MTKIELGAVGAVLDPGDGYVEAAVALEELGYPTIWITGGSLQDLGQIAEVVQATEHVRVATAIIPVVRFPADDVAALYARLEATHPGRFVVGLGGAHGPNPFAILNAYLDRLDASPTPVPARARVLAALGPRMLDLARDRAAGALPVFTTPGHTADARTRLGDDTTLAVDQMVLVEPDPTRARDLARRRLGFFVKVPAYQASFRRMGFTDEEITDLADRLVDGLFAWGDPDAIAERVLAQQAAGADHVAMSINAADSGSPPLDEWRQLARRLISP